MPCEITRAEWDYGARSVRVGISCDDPKKLRRVATRIERLGTPDGETSGWLEKGAPPEEAPPEVGGWLSFHDLAEVLDGMVRAGWTDRVGAVSKLRELTIEVCERLKRDYAFVCSVPGIGGLRPLEWWHSMAVEQARRYGEHTAELASALALLDVRVGRWRR